MQNNEKKVVELNLGDVLPNRFQPRIKFDEESINELAASIRKYGVIQPIVVRQIGDKYEIIAGERRYKASVIAGKETIPAIIYDLSDKDSVEIALLENVQREDLTPIEKAVSYKKILDMGYINQEDLAQKIGKSQSSIANTLRLLNLAEEVQEALLETKISERHARSLLKIKDEKQQVMMLNRIINERLTVRKTDEEIEKMFKEEGNNGGIVNVPEANATENNFTGFMNIDNLESSAKPADGDQPGNFFNMFEDNSLLDQFLAGNTETGNAENKQEPVMPEFNFGVPATETPSVETPSADDSDSDSQKTMQFGTTNFDIPSVEPVMPEFNFDVPATDAPSVEPVMPEFNFDVPATETPSVEPVMPEFNFDVPANDAPLAEPAMPEFNFDVPTAETPSAEPVMPEFNFDVPANDAPLAEPAMPEFNFDVPANETPSVEPAMPEFNFDVPTTDAPSVEPAMPEFNFDVPATETPSVEAAMPEFNFDVPTTDAPSAEPSMPEFNFDIPTTDAPSVEPVMPEFNFDVPANDAPLAEPAPEGHHGLFGLFGKKKEETTEDSGEQNTIPLMDNQPVEIPAFEENVPTVDASMTPNIRMAIDVVRNCETNLQNMGFTVDVNEVDLGNEYQVVIKINK